MRDLMAGEHVRDLFFAAVRRYRWMETLGQGGMGIVFKVKDLELDEVEALKVLSVFEENKPDALIRFKREVVLNRKVKHPNVARLYEFGAAAGFHYITMEFIEGRDLRKLIKEGGPLTPSKAVTILRQVALGMEAAHAHGIVHRDLTPQNIIVDAIGGVAILDFGIARTLDADSVTAGDQMVGTPSFMSPEQFGGEPPDVRSDIYSLGVIAYQTLTGLLPFKADSLVTLVMKVTMESVPMEPLRRRPGVTAELADIILKCLGKTPESRFQTGGELETALRDLVLPTDSGSFHTPMHSEASTRELPRPSHVSASETSTLQEMLSTHRMTGPGAPAHGERSPVAMIVEDDTPLRAAYALALKEAGFVVHEAGDGPAALGKLLNVGVDVVFMDVRLPVMDGFDVTRILRRQPGGRNLPIVLVSSSFDRERMAFGIQAGATEIVKKPITPAEVVSRLRKYADMPEEGNLRARARQ